MVKAKSGLPEGFDLSVSAEDLNGPASLPGYLDEDPVVVFASLKKEQSKPKPEVLTPIERPLAAQVEIQEAAPTIAEPKAHLVAEMPAFQAMPLATAPKEQRNQQGRRRFQINLEAETEYMVEELLGLLSAQSGENRIKLSELFHALLLNLYNAKGEIVLGSLPVRGRWGTPTAKLFPVALAESLREAIVNHENLSGGNPFKRAAGQ